MDDLDSIAKECAAYRLRRASRVVTRRYEQALRPVRLSSFQFTTLVALSKTKMLPQAALAKEFGMDLSTLTRNLKPLIKRELVTLSIAPNDKRVKYVSISPVGCETLEIARPLWKSAQSATLKDISPAEWDTFKNLISKIA